MRFVGARIVLKEKAQKQLVYFEEMRVPSVATSHTAETDKETLLRDCGVRLLSASWGPNLGECISKIPVLVFILWV